MKHRYTTTIFALAAALTLGACSGEQGMQDSAAAQTGTGTTPAGGPNTNDTSAARPGGTAGAATAGTGTTGTGTAGDTTRRDTTRAGTGTPRTTP
jgi:hypothetical protein